MWYNYYIQDTTVTALWDTEITCYCTNSAIIFICKDNFLRVQFLAIMELLAKFAKIKISNLNPLKLIPVKISNLKICLNTVKWSQ